MFKLKPNDFIKIKDDRYNDFYCGKVFQIVEGHKHSYSLLGGSTCRFPLSDFEYVQPNTLTIKKVLNADVLVNCRTPEDAEYFWMWLALHKRKQNIECAHSVSANWHRYKEKTCYSVKRGLFGDMNLKKWSGLDANKNPIRAIIRFSPSMIQNDPIWQTDNADKNSVLTDISGSAASDIIHPKITAIEFNDKITTVTIGDKQIKVTCHDGDTYSSKIPQHRELSYSF